MAYLIRKSEPESIETESTMPGVGGVAGAGGGGNGEDGVSAQQEEKIREVDGAEGRTPVGMYLTPVNFTLKNGQYGNFCSMLLPQLGTLQNRSIKAKKAERGFSKPRIAK